MKNLQALVNEANKKVAAKKRRKVVPSVDQLMAGSGPGSTSSPVVDLEEGGRSNERAQEPVKKRRVETPSKDPVTPIKATPLRSESGDFLQLPKVWSKLDHCGPNATLFLDDPELWVIHDLGPAGQSKAITEGVIATMKALEVATTLNNASLENEIWVNGLRQERDALTAKVAALEEDARSKRSVAKVRDCQFAAMEEQLAEARAALGQATDSSRKLAEEKASLEEGLKKADLPGEEEAEDTAGLRRADLVDKIGELEGSLVEAVQLGFDRAVAQLKVVNQGIELCVEGIHHLYDVEDSVIKPPPNFEEDVGHVDETQPDEAL